LSCPRSCWALALLAGALLAAPLTGAVSAQERRLTLEAFSATIEVQSSGALEVREELRFHFAGSWNGVFRTIPVLYDLGASRHRIRLQVIDVRDLTGEALRYETSREGAYRRVRIWVPGARDATRTVVLRYRVREALRFYETHDELYWNVTGNEWDVPIQSATARVILPDGASGRRAAAYTGAYGERGEGSLITEIEEGFFFRTTGPLAFREGMTVVVGWDPGLVHRPGALERALRAGLFLFALPVVSLIGMWRLWLARGRDPQRRPVSPRYEPPEGLSPAEAGTLVDNRPDMRDLTATLVDLAVRGYLRIEEEDRSGLARLLTKQHYTFRRLRAAGDELRPHERRMHGALFSGREAVSTRDMEHEFYKELPGMRTVLFDELKRAGYYHRRPDRVLQGYLVFGAAVLGLATAGLVSQATERGYSPVLAALAGVATGLPVLLFGLVMPARTVRGARRLEEVLGFEEFLDRVDSDRFRRMIKSPEQFEAFLPYAMAFGVEKRWARAFDDLYTEPPSWYVGSQPGSSFRPSNLVSNLDTMATRASSAMASAPRSSGSSGFSSGGGFSGGGSGGGGGGGW
jgi:uncharacterized membrane protein YgcG